MPNEDDVMLLKIEIDPQSLQEAMGKVKEAAEAEVRPAVLRPKGTREQEEKFDQQEAEALGYGKRVQPKTKKSAKEMIYDAIEADVLSGKQPSFAKPPPLPKQATPPPLPKMDPQSMTGLMRGIYSAFRGGQGGIGSAISSVGQIGASGFGALGIVGGAAAAAVGLWTAMLKASMAIIDSTANKLKDFNASIFAASTQLEYFWMGFKYRIGRQLENVLPSLMEKSSTTLARLIELGADLLVTLAPVIESFLRTATVIIDFAKIVVDAAKYIASGVMEKGSNWLKMTGAVGPFVAEAFAGKDFDWGKQKDKSFEQLVNSLTQIQLDVKGIRNNTDDKEGVALASALFGSMREWSRSKGKDFGDIGVGGFQKTPNAANILKDITGLKPQEDFFLNGAGAGANARFPGPEKTTNHFKAADTIKIEFSDYDRIMFAIQNAMNEMLTKTTRSGDMRFNLLQANLARITR